MSWIGQGRATADSPATPLWRPAARLAALLRAARAGLIAEFETEIAERRLFLWLPVCAGAGVALYFNALREPWAFAAPMLAALAAVLAWRVGERRALRLAFAAVAAMAAGFASAQWRAIRVAAPAIDRIRIAEMTGTIEEMDIRRQGARFLLRVASLDGLPPESLPFRVRLSMRERPRAAAGDFIALKARLLPPARAALPGGYDFAADAYFARIGAVGSILGRMEILPAPEPPDLRLLLMAQVDRARNALAERIDAIVAGDAGAIAVAMVTGKRDRLSEGARELIREAGIFHIITISGIQMTLVAGIFFWLLRRLFGLSRTLSLQFPVKKWAAAGAILGAMAYDVGTGSRVGTERALFMTMIVFLAVLFDRQAFTMRNLALAALAVIALEPEAILGASFQLSFAAVAALVAVYEARSRSLQSERDGVTPNLRKMQQAPKNAQEQKFFGFLPAAAGALQRWTRHGIGAALLSTFCATSATASFMAYHFHELSPYVLIGNPLTLGIIEFFAVPGALLGTLLYPVGLDAPVWLYLGLGIEFVLWVARWIAAAPGAGLHVRAFAPWAIAFLSLGVLSIVIWRTWAWRATALPLLAIGLAGANAGPRFDVLIAPSGEALAFRGAEGQMHLLGKRPNLFAAEQWLRADGDGRAAKSAIAGACDAHGCVAALAGRVPLALTLAKEAFADDCQRARILVTPLFAPAWCAAPYIFDRASLRQTGAVSLRLASDGALAAEGARAAGEDRPWSPKPANPNPPLRRPAKPPAPLNTPAEAENLLDPPFR